MRRPQVVVVGSYAAGLTMKASRIPGAGETILGSGYRIDFGGKGSNQAVGCARLGAEVTFVAKIGQDSFGDMALGLYRQEGVDVSMVQRTGDAPTGVGFIIVEQGSGQNAIVLDPGANEQLTPEEVFSVKPAIASASVLLTQLEIPVAAAEAALRSGRSAGAITILNPAPVRSLPSSVLGLVDVLTPNEKEARVLAGYSPGASVDPLAVARELLRSGVRTVVVTLGDKGALLMDSSGHRHFPAVRVQPVDTTGAGDAFNAGLATALSCGVTLEEAVQFAVLIGAMAVTDEGVIPSLPGRKQVFRFCTEHQLEAPKWLRTNADTN